MQTLEKRQGLKIACLEEIAFKMKFIDLARYKQAAERYAKSEYGQYLQRTIAELG